MVARLAILGIEVRPYRRSRALELDVEGLRLGETIELDPEDFVRQAGVAVPLAGAVRCWSVEGVEGAALTIDTDTIDEETGDVVLAQICRSLQDEMAGIPPAPSVRV